MAKNRKKPRVYGDARKGMIGRPPNTPNKASALREKKYAEQGVLPLDVMMEAVRYNFDKYQAFVGKGNTKKAEEYLGKAASKAEQAAPYIHPRLSAIAVKPIDPNEKPEDRKITFEFVETTQGLPGENPVTSKITISGNK